MGRIFDRFGHLKFHNEAEVSQNFLIPLLTEFLGYHREEILPEHVIEAFYISQSREKKVSTALLPPKARPDYIVTIDSQDWVVVCDSKGPDENLDDHLDQLKAYCIASGTNLLLITNGTELRIYDANNLVIESTSVGDLDLKFSEVYKLLNRADAAKYAFVERIQTLDLSRSLGKDSEALQQEHQRRVAITLSDFSQYLDAISQVSTILELPVPIRSALESDLRHFPAEELYCFQEYDGGDLRLEKRRPLSYRTILKERPNIPVLLIGESGIGKTSLLQQFLFDQTKRCLEYSSDVVPVLVKLGQYSQSRSVPDLIFDALFSKGANITRDQLSSFLRDGRFVILFDAFDETFEHRVPDLEGEIQSLTVNYRKCKVIITTRHFRLPRLTPIRRYELQPLSDQRIEAFAQMYLDSDCRTFLDEIARKGLAEVASNTLLLTLLILLYLAERELPRSRGQILQAVVKRVRDWDQSKAKRFASPLSWEIREELLTQLAFSSLSSGKSYALDKQSVEITLTDVLNELERRRQIPPGLTLDQVLDSLASTGFILKMDEGVVFWHRAFVEHFAAAEIARRIESVPHLLENLIGKPECEDVLPLAAAKASDPPGFIKRILAHNIFTAARALVECNVFEGEVYRRVVDNLSRKCDSQTLPIRWRAIDLLRQLEGSYVDAQFHNLLDSEFVDIQKVALVEIARRKATDAREIVFSRLDWDVPAPTWIEGGSGNAVIEALGEFDDTESQLQIISIWRERPDMFTSESCHDAFLKIAKRGKVSDKVKRALLDFFLSDEKHVRHKLWELSEVLVALGDSDVISSLISALRHFNLAEGLIRAWRTAEVLASFDEPEVIQQLIECANDRNLNDYARAWFAEALSKSKGMVPLEVFEALARDDDDGVKSHGVRGLGRFSFEDVRAIVLREVHPPPFDLSPKIAFSFARVQAAAFEVLAQHDQIELLLEEENRPEYLHRISLEVLFEAISSHHLYSMIPLVEAVVERINDKYTIIKAASVLADLGYIDRAQEIIETLRRDGLSQGWVVHAIVEGIHRLPASYALSFIDEVLSKGEEIEGDGSGYLRSLCIEALERIGTPEACERLAQIAWASAEDGVGIDTERALRSIEFLAPRDRENWLLQLISEHPNMGRTALQRALDTLGIVGSQDSLPLLQEYFNGPYPASLQAVCFWAMHDIHKRTGQLWFNGEEKGL
jgi:HEAT repeat protein